MYTKDDDNIKYHTEEIGFCCRESGETRGNKVETTDSITEKIKKAAKQVIEDTITKTEEQFDSLINHTVIKAATVMNPHNWPGDALQDYGDQEIEQLYNAFQEPLKARHVDLHKCTVQWTDLKKHISRKRKAERETKRKGDQKQSKCKRKKSSKNDEDKHSDSYLHYHEMWSFSQTQTLWTVFRIFCI